MPTLAEILAKKKQESPAQLPVTQPKTQDQPFPLHLFLHIYFLGSKRKYLRADFEVWEALKFWLLPVEAPPEPAKFYPFLDCAGNEGMAYLLGVSEAAIHTAIVTLLLKEVSYGH